MSYAHQHFWTLDEVVKHPANVDRQVHHLHHRFCKHHFKDISKIPVDLREIRNPGVVYPGCCSTAGGTSPGVMQRHLERKHPELCPTKQHSEDSDSSDEKEYDQAIMDQAAYARCYLMGTPLLF